MDEHDRDTAPRQHHYVFAHHALREMVLSDPKRALAALTGPLATRLLLDLWSEVGEMAGSDALPASGLDHSAVELEQGQLVAVIVRLPPPQRITEAHFVGLLFSVKQAPFRRKVTVRYFTLEHSEDLDDGGPITILCEWAGANHLNFGRGPAPFEAGFVAAILARPRP